MNKQKFIEYLKNPTELNEHHLEELDELVTEYPYFQAGRVLEAKANRALKTRIAGKKTASAAIYSTNRILFKKYLKEGMEAVALPPSESRPSSTAPPAPTPTVEVTTTQEPVVSEKVEVKIDDTQGSSKIDRLIYDLQQDMKELEKSRARYIEVTRKIEEEEAVEKAVKKATGNVRASATATKNTGSITRSTTRKTSAGSTKSATSKTGTAKSSTRKTPASKTSATKKTGTSKTTAKNTSSRSRTTSTKKPTTAKKTAATKKTTAKSSTRKSSTRAPRTSKTTKTAKKEEGEGGNQRELIDQFIKSNPSFKPEGDSKSQKDLSLESTILPEDLVSEHLAEIFIKQGKRDKAIKIYNSLMLRFPEKKTYFAGRINEIE